MQEPNERTIITVDVIAHILIKGWEDTIECLLKQEKFKDIKQNILNQLAVEFLVLYFYYFNTVLIRILPEEEHNKIFEEIRIRAAQRLAKRDTAYVNVKEEADRINVMMDRVEYIKKYGMVVNFLEIFYKRLEEYASYKYFLKVEENGIPIEESKNNTLKAFNEKITKLLKDDTIRFDLISIPYFKNYEKELDSKGISIMKFLRKEAIYKVKETNDLGPY